MTRIFIGIANSYPSVDKPYQLIFVHRWFKQIESQFDKVVVITRDKRKITRRLFRNINEFRHIGKIKTEKYDGFLVHRILTINFFPENYLPFNSFLIYRKIKNIIHEETKEIDKTIIHIATWGDFSFASAIAVSRLGLKYFTSAIGNYENHYYNKKFNVNQWVLKYIYKKSEFVICVSRALQFKVHQISNKIETYLFYSGVNTRVFCKLDQISDNQYTQWRLDKTSFYYSFVGRICKEKGIYELLEAFSIINIKYPNTYLLLIGQLNDKELEISIKKSKNIIWVPPQGEVEINELLNISDTFVFPSWSEGTPNSIQEAMAVGLPIIATNVGGIPDLIEHGQNGILIDRFNVELLIKYMSMLYLDKDLRIKLGKEASLSICNEFDYWKNGEMLIHKLHSCKLLEDKK